MAVNTNDAGVAADVTELVVVWAGHDFPAEAAHEADSWLLGGGVVIMVVVGAWRRRSGA